MTARAALHVSFSEADMDAVGSPRDSPLSSRERATMAGSRPVNEHSLGSLTVVHYSYALLLRWCSKLVILQVRYIFACRLLIFCAETIKQRPPLFL